ncbi:MAG: hypothetical protein JOZ29_11170 [Deltaproteobacteria bacterium]|nr:hypothetical protein [Deltaproteobacteria bacterium]
MTTAEIKRQFPREETHYEFLRTLSGQEQWTIKYLYDRLNIIDSKTGALLRVNSTIMGFLGAIVVLLARRDLVPDLTLHKGWFLFFMILDLLVLLASDIVSLIGIFWLRFDRISDPEDFNRYRRRFYEVTRRREGFLQLVVVLSITGEIGFAVIFIVLAALEIIS